MKGDYIMETKKTSSREKLIKLVIAAMFAALICVMTMVVEIRVGSDGFINLGDGFILIAAWVLGPVYGFAAAGIGSAFADLFSGYMHYVPGTFVIKGLIALAAALIAHAFIKKSEKLRIPGYIASGIVGEAIMVGGYYLYYSLLLGRGWAAAFMKVPGNVAQGVAGIVLGVVISTVIAQTKLLKLVHYNYSYAM